MMSRKDCPYYKDTDEIRSETTFVYDNEEYKFYLDDYTREFGYFLTRFHIIADMEHAKKFLDNKTFFKGLFLKLNMPVECYIAGFEHNGRLGVDRTKDKFKISIVGEEKRNEI